MDRKIYLEHEFHAYSSNCGLIRMLVQISKEIDFDYEQILITRNYIDNEYLNESNIDWCLGRALDDKQHVCRCDTTINVEINRSGEISGNIRFKGGTRDDIYFIIDSKII